MMRASQCLERFGQRKQSLEANTDGSISSLKVDEFGIRASNDEDGLKVDEFGRAVMMMIPSKLRSSAGLEMEEIARKSR